MKRRSLLKLGIGAAVVLGVAGAGVALMRPALINGKFSTDVHALMRAVAEGVLDGLLPVDASARSARLSVQLAQLETTIAGLPAATRSELSQLLALLATGAGRFGLVGLTSDWASASAAEVREGLSAMGASSIGLRQQVYHALRDLNTLVFFNDPSSWALVGYPGPREIAV